MPTPGARAARSRSSGARLAAALLALGAGTALAAPPPVEVFAARSRIEGAALSPDGRYLALTETPGGRGVVVVIDRRAGEGTPRVVLAEPAHFRIAYCRFVTGVRLVCELRGLALRDGRAYPLTRLAAVDADGRHLRVLLEADDDVPGPFQDHVVAWEAGAPGHLLVEATELAPAGRVRRRAFELDRLQRSRLPAVYDLDAVQGGLTLRQHARAPVHHWIADGRGTVRLGLGSAGTTIAYYARLSGTDEWRELEHFEAFSRGAHFRPVAITRENPDEAYALGPADGRQALWRIDLRGVAAPALVYARPDVDLGEPVMSADGRLLAVPYETERPQLEVRDLRLRSLLDGVDRLLPGAFSTVVDATADESLYVVRSVRERRAPSYALVDAAHGTLTPLGVPPPGLEPEALAAPEPLRYAARDGVPVPAYLTTPTDRPRPWPLVVLPHGGPMLRDTWRYSFLRAFLVSRGYAVLQPNFRGSTGYGEDWFYAAYQDWAGRTYDDVVDAARWAVDAGIARADRVCIVGWSFGGYLALLAAERDPGVFRCAASIAGISDLDWFIEDQAPWDGEALAALEIGGDRARRHRDSPRRAAAAAAVPLLLVHGERDSQVAHAQSVAMDSALRRAGRSPRFLSLADGDHALSAPADRAALLSALEAFLGTYLAP